MGSITFSEIMEFYPEHNASVYGELKNACQRGYLIPFVGAGLSVFCGYQTWPDVLRWLSKYVYSPDVRADAEAMIAAGRLLEAAQVIQDNYPRIFQELQKIIDYDKIKNCDESQLYACAAYVLPYLFSGGLVMTTNFDRVLEEIYDKCRTKFGNIISPYEPDYLTQARQNNPHCLFKLHGDIGPELRDIKKLVFTQEQYDEAYAGPLMKELSQWFQTKKLLFLGCSLAMDRTMEVLQHVTAANPGLDHYAILACRPEDIPQRCREMGMLGISPIYYPEGKHEAVRVILERLLEDTNHAAYEELKHRTKTTAPVTSASRRFMYDADYIGFFGRKDELVQLQEFCQCPEHISWWAVTGPGGMGKSRLVYQFAKEKTAAGWEVCWLQYGDYDDLIHWVPPTDRCIVVADDVQAHIQAVGKWMVSISSHIRSEKLRILLLERDGKELNSTGWVEMLQADLPYDDTISSRCYRPDFLSLGPLHDDDLKAIMIDFAQVSGRRLKGLDHADLLLQTLKKVDGDLQRPMYALAITDAWCSGEDPTHWNKAKILDALINRELKFYYDRLRGLTSVSKEMRGELENLLARSCVVPLLMLDEIDRAAESEYPRLNKKAGKLDMTFRELLRQTGAIRKVGIRVEVNTEAGRKKREAIVEAIFLDCPDLVKEHLVLRQAFERGNLNLLLPENWDNNPIPLLFVDRLLLDYPERLAENGPFLTQFLAGQPTSAFPARIYSHLLFGVTVQLPQKRGEAMTQLEKLYDRFCDNEDIVVEYSHGLVSLSGKQVLESCERSVDKLRCLCEQHPSNEVVRGNYAQGLAILSSKQSSEDCARSIGELERLYGQATSNEELAVMYARGLFNLSNVQALEDCVLNVGKLNLLCEQFPANEVLAVAYAGGLIALSQKQGDYTYSVDKLGLMREQFPESVGVAFAYANSLCGLSAEQTLEDCMHSMDKLSRLYEQFQTREELVTIYAHGLLGLFEKQALEDRMDSVDKLEQVHKRFPANERLAAMYAYSLALLIIEQPSTDRRRSLDRLQFLYEQFPENESLMRAYADSLRNLSTHLILEDCTHAADKLRFMHKRFPTNEKVSVAYGGSLVNLSLVQEKEADVQESLNQVQELYMQCPTNTELQLSYAQTYFNLTLKQESEALGRSVSQLREFLLTHPEANLNFQNALDTYFGKHPEHTQRYASLRV